MPENVRAFVAVGLSPEACEAVSRVLTRLQRAGSREVRWVASEGMHLTLKFLGDVAQERLGGIEQALGRVAAASTPLTLELGAPGVFPGPRAPRVVWLGLQGQMDGLGRLQRGIEKAMADLDFPPEGRAFQPHITLGRVRMGARVDARRLMEALGRLQIESVSWSIDEVVLMRSILTSAGAIYQRIASYPLGMGLSESH